MLCLSTQLNLLNVHVLFDIYFKKVYILILLFIFHGSKTFLKKLSPNIKIVSFAIVLSELKPTFYYLLHIYT